MKSLTAGEGEKATKRWSKSLGPMRIAAGPTDEGEAGVSLVGADSLVMLRPSCKGVGQLDGLHWRPVGRLDYSIDAGWTSASNSRNSSSFSLRPTLSLQKMRFVGVKSPGYVLPASPEGSLTIEDAAELLEEPPSGRFIAPRPITAISFFADLRYRFGEFDDGNNGVTRANQFIYGGGIEASWLGANWLGEAREGRNEAGPFYGFFREPPRLSLGYYRAEEADGNETPVPEELSADYVTLMASFEVALPWPGDHLYESPVLLRYQYKGSEPTTGGAGFESYHNASLVYVLGAKASPALTFRSGQEQGLEYDRQVILGILWSFAGF